MYQNVLYNELNFTHVPTKQLEDITRENIDGKRHYRTSAGTFISITTLLSSKTPQGILDWRESIGNDVADYIMRTAANRGTKMHEIVENYLSNKPNSDLVGSYGVLAAGLFNLIVPELDRINNVHVLEAGLYSSRLKVAGTVDCIAEFDGKLSTIDFKTASKKRDEINENYLLQATFYSLAWKEMTGQSIEQIVIITATEKGEMYVHVDDPAKYVAQLEQVVEDYNFNNI